MMDTLIKLQQAEIAETQNQQELKTKSVEFTRNLGSAVSNLMDEMHAEAWEDIPKVHNLRNLLNTLLFETVYLKHLKLSENVPWIK